jgi:hypothetical protein
MHHFIRHSINNPNTSVPQFNLFASGELGIAIVTEHFTNLIRPIDEFVNRMVYDFYN